MSSDAPRRGRSDKKPGARRSGPPKSSRRSDAPRSGDGRRSGPPRAGGAKKAGRGGANRGGAGRRDGSPRRDENRRSNQGPPRREDRRRSDDERGPRRERGSGREQDRRTDRDLAGPAQWGRIARRGAGNMDYDDPETIARREERQRRPRPPKADSDEAAPRRTGSRPDAADLERAAQRAVSRGRGAAATARERRRLPARPHAVKEPAAALRKLVGEPRSKTLNRKLNEAAKAFEAERFGDARTQLGPIVKEAPELPEGRELMGLTLYRLGKWKDAIEHLESFRELSGSTEQHPVLADCHRALGHWADVDVLWEELGEASPSAELVVEGRIVVAGAKADQGDLTSAIRLLEQNWRPPKRPQGHHLRRAYALADLYDRAGRAPRARELFSWVQGHAPDLADVRARVKALS